MWNFKWSKSWIHWWTEHLQVWKVCSHLCAFLCSNLYSSKPTQNLCGWLILGNEYSLRIEGLAWDNAGRYTARASNSHGQAETECKVKLTTKSQRELSKCNVHIIKLAACHKSTAGFNFFVGKCQGQQKVCWKHQTCRLIFKCVLIGLSTIESFGE